MLRQRIALAALPLDPNEVRGRLGAETRDVAVHTARRLREDRRRGEVRRAASLGVLVEQRQRRREGAYYIEAYVLESTPSLLTLGKRCKELGYRFLWEPFCDPKFYDPKGQSVKVDVINNIPYLSPSETEVVAGRSDLPRVYPALPAPIVVHEKVVDVGESQRDEADALGELDLDMPQEASRSSRSRGDGADDVSKAKGPPPSPEPQARDLRAEAKSIRHLMTHLPKNPYCDACQRAKTENVKSFRQDSPRDKGFEKFGEHVTVDTMVLHGLGNRGNNGETDAVVFYDLATGWLEAVPVKGRTNSDTLRAFQQMFGQLDDVNAFSMDTERR
eukprot:s3106_g14.t1